MSDRTPEHEAGVVAFDAALDAAELGYCHGPTWVDADKDEVVSALLAYGWQQPPLN